jgi:CheY-like chemotaxis protein
LAKSTPLVLVVDDERTIRTLLRRILEGAGYRVSEAGNGNEALRTLENETPDAMLVDISMPEMDGFELLAEVHRTGRQPKIIALSGFMADAMLPVAEKLGAVGVLEKPFTAERLLSEIRRVMDQR